MTTKLTDEQIKDMAVFFDNEVELVYSYLIEYKVENRKLQKLIKEYKQAKSNLGEFIMINYLDSI